MYRMKKHPICHFMTIYVIVFNHHTDKSFVNNADTDCFHVSEQQEKAKKKHPWGASSCLLVGATLPPLPNMLPHSYSPLEPEQINQLLFWIDRSLKGRITDFISTLILPDAYSRKNS